MTMSHHAGDKVVPQHSLNPPGMAGTGAPAKECWFFTVQPHSPALGFVLVVLLDAHKEPPLPIPKETDLTSTCNISASSAFLPLRMPMSHCGGASGGCPSLTPTETPSSLLLCGQNATLWGRFLQCLQLVECSSARLVPSWCQSAFPMNVTLL